MLKHLQINKWLALYPLLLFVANLISKGFYLTDQEIGLDEPFSIYHAQFDPGILIDQLKNYNNPPGFELILHYWIRLFGVSPLSVRILPLIFASLSPPALYYFGKRYFSLSAGIISSLLLSASSLLLYYAHDCRVYSLFLLLSILSMHCFLSLLSEGKVRTIFFFILSGALLIYSHYFGVFILFFQGIYLILFYRDRILKFSIYYLILLVFYLPYLYPMLIRMNESVSHGTWIQTPAGLESLYNMLWSYSNAPVVTVLCLGIFLAALFFAIKKKDLVPDKKTILLLCWFLIPFFGLFFISYEIPVYISRYLIFVLPAYYLLLAISLDHLFDLKKLKLAALVILVLCFVCSADLNPDKKQHTLEGVNLINRFKDHNTLVIVSPHDFSPSFAYYYNRNYFSKVDDGIEYRLTDSLLRTDQVYVLNTISDEDLQKINGFSKLIYFGNGEESGRAESLVLKPLMKNYLVTETKKFSNTYAIYFLSKK